MWREPFAKRRCLVPASGLYEWPKPGHATSDTYSEEETGTSADFADPLSVSGDLFGAAPKPARKAKTTKPIKRVFNITLTEPDPFAFAGIWTHGSGRMEHTLRRSHWSRQNPMSS
jgi:putative SOS response-associated peptidase YedK